MNKYHSRVLQAQSLRRLIRTLEGLTIHVNSLKHIDVVQRRLSISTAKPRRRWCTHQASNLFVHELDQYWQRGDAGVSRAFHTVVSKPVSRATCNLESAALRLSQLRISLSFIEAGTVKWKSFRLTNVIFYIIPDCKHRVRAMGI